MKTNVVLAAREFAFTHHGLAQWDARMGQHLAMVARFTKLAGGTSAMLATAWLHDVVEDTAATLDAVEAEFGVEIREMVDGLTDPLHYRELNLGFRKQLQAKRITKLPVQVQTIKVADQTANVAEIAVRPPARWTPEKALLYVEGGKQIVEATYGVPEVLLAEFAKAYDAACAAHG